MKNGACDAYLDWGNHKRDPKKYKGKTLCPHELYLFMLLHYGRVEQKEEHGETKQKS